MGLEFAGTVALASGVAWASGLNLYAALLMLGVLGSAGALILPPDLQFLTHPLVIAAAALMYCTEFFADKIPGVDSVWDALHTFVRIPAGAILAAAAAGELAPAAQLGAFILGGALASGTHAAKSGSRALINTSPEPVSNWTASIAEDVMVVAGLWTALHHPLIFLGLLAMFAIMLVWLLPRLARTLGQLYRRFRALFGRSRQTAGATAACLPPQSLDGIEGPP